HHPASTSSHTATTYIYTLSLHDALPIFPLDPAQIILHQDFADRFLYLLKSLALPAYEASPQDCMPAHHLFQCLHAILQTRFVGRDRKSTRLNSSHLVISYAVFCLKKKKK